MTNNINYLINEILIQTFFSKISKWTLVENIFLIVQKEFIDFWSFLSEVWSEFLTSVGFGHLWISLSKINVEILYDWKGEKITVNRIDYSLNGCYLVISCMLYACIMLISYPIYPCGIPIYTKSKTLHIYTFISAAQSAISPLSRSTTQISI